MRIQVARHDEMHSSRRAGPTNGETDPCTSGGAKDVAQTSAAEDKPVKLTKGEKKAMKREKNAKK